jgi:transcriptional regulator with XRE-family HTH domain
MKSAKCQREVNRDGAPGKVAVAAALVAIDRFGGNVSELARRSGVARTTINATTAGRRSLNLRHLLRIANASDLRLSELICLAEERSALVGVDRHG